VIVNLDMQQDLEKFAGPDRWNDPDMLQVGNGALTESESRAHFSLWCMLAAPLMLGNDLSKMDAMTRTILTNRHLIAIDQDPLAKQGFKIKDLGQTELYFKPLTRGNVALCFFNRHHQSVEIQFDWQTMNLRTLINGKRAPDATDIIDRKDIALQGRFSIFNAWSERRLGENTGMFTKQIQGHDVVVLLLEKVNQ